MATLSQQINALKTSLKDDRSKLGIAKNTVLGLPQAARKVGGFTRDYVAKPATESLLVKPALRTGQAIGTGIAAGVSKATGNPQYYNRAIDRAYSDQKVNVPFLGLGSPTKLQKPTPRQITGEGLESASYLYAPTKAVQAVSPILKGASVPLRQTASNITRGALGGYSADVGIGLQDRNQSVRQALKPGLGTAIGAAIPTAGGAYQAGRYIKSETDNLLATLPKGARQAGFAKLPDLPDPKRNSIKDLTNQYKNLSRGADIVDPEKPNLISPVNKSATQRLGLSGQASVTNKTIKHIVESHGDQANEIIEAIPKTLAEPTKVVDNSAKRANSYLFARKNGKNYGVVLEVTKTPDGDRVVSAFRVDNKTYEKMTDIFGRTASRSAGFPPFATPEGEIQLSRLSGVKDSIDTSLSKTDDFVNKNPAGDLPPLPKLSKTSDQTTLGIKNIARKGGQKIPEQKIPAGSQRPPQDTGLNLPKLPKLKTTSLSDSIAQKSQVVQKQTEPRPLSEATYSQNRIKLSQKPSKLKRIKNLLLGAKGSFGETTDKVLGTISTRLKNIDPSLKRAIRDFEFKLANNTQADKRKIVPFLKKIRSKDIDLQDYADLDLALKNGDILKINKIISKYGLDKEFKQVRNLLDDLYKRAEDVGYDIGYEKNYFPRTIEDPAGLLEYFQKGDDWSLIDEAIKAKEIDLQRYLTVEEKANVINTLMRGYPQGRVTLSKTGAMKNRSIDIVDAELNQFYGDSVGSLLKYVDQTNDAIEARRFFGKGKKADQFANIDDSIGNYILDLMAKGKVRPSQERELREILQARFKPLGTSGAVRVYKNLSYIDTMGSPISAITQLGDLAFAIYKGGPVETAKAFGRALAGKSKITRQDIGIEKIAQEFSDSSRSASAVTKVFKAVGLEKLDALGKESVINATIGRYRKLASRPTPDFLRRIGSVFGDETDSVLADLKAGKITENVKLLAFNELLDVQPVALSEMPEMYLKGGNGRIFYMLKTYTVKLFDVYRNEVFQEISAGRKAQGLKNLIYLSGALVTMNATADEIKDLVLNRETSLKDRTVDNILKLAGFSKFTIYKARMEGIGSATARTILPPFKFIDSAYKDVVQANELSQLETIQSIPVGGKLYYWWFGKGAAKSDKKREKASPTNSTGLPKLPKIKGGGLPTLPKIGF